MGTTRSDTFMSSGTATNPLSPNESLPDLTDTLQLDQKRIVGRGSFSIVYRCSRVHGEDVAVKAIVLPVAGPTEKQAFLRKLRRELGIWRRLDTHRNIVQLLGMTDGAVFGSDQHCLVSTWMPNGTLHDYISYRWATLSSLRRIDLIKGSVAGLEYLHSQNIIHGDLHPGNIMIDGDHNARLTDFGFSQIVEPEQGPSYLWTKSVLPGAVMFAAPELLCRDQKVDPSLSSDIYSLGSIIFFIISGRTTWNCTLEALRNLRKFQNPPRPTWPAEIPDGIWDFILQCWSPRNPRIRPTAHEVLSFTNDTLGQLLREPSSASLINVVLFGATGCRMSSVVDLLAGDSNTSISSDARPRIKLPKCYEISSGEKRFRLWNTTQIHHADGGDTSPFSSYERAHALLQQIPDGINLILLCANKDEMGQSLGHLYYFINNLLYRGHAPIALVLTSGHSDSVDEQWSEDNQQLMAEKTGIPVQYLPFTCVTMVQSGRDRSREALKLLLQTAASSSPISPNPDLSDSSDKVTDSLAEHCGLSILEVRKLLLKFRRQPRPLNVVFFGESGAGMSSVINLISENPVAEVSSAIRSCTTHSHSYPVNTGTRQFLVWDTMGFNSIHMGGKMPRRAEDDAKQLVRDLYRKGGIDLLVFCKKSGQLTSSERDSFKFFETLCGVQVQVAVVITHLESMHPMEKWWDDYGEKFKLEIGRDVVGHACITSLSGDHPNIANFSQKLSESRKTMQTMLEDAVWSLSAISQRS